MHPTWGEGKGGEREGGYMDCGQWAGEAVITTDVSQAVGLTGGVKGEKTPSRRLDLGERVGLGTTGSHSLLQERIKCMQCTPSNGFPGFKATENQVSKICLILIL